MLRQGGTPAWLAEETVSRRRVVLKHLEPLRNQGLLAKKHEKRVAKEMGGRRLPASGALPFGKRDKNTAGADVRTDKLLIQHKGTKRDSLAVKRDWLYEVTKEAARRSLDPALMVYFERERRFENEWVVIPKSVFNRLMANQLEGAK